MSFTYKMERNMSESILKPGVEELKKLVLAPTATFDSKIAALQNCIIEDLSCLGKAKSELIDHYVGKKIFYTADYAQNNNNYLEGISTCLQETGKLLNECEGSLSETKFLSTTQSVALESAYKNAENYAHTFRDLIFSLNSASADASEYPEPKNLEEVLKQDLNFIGDQKKRCENEFYSSVVLELWEAWATEIQFFVPLFKKTMPSFNQEALLPVYARRRACAARTLENAVQKDYAVECLDNTFFARLGAELPLYDPIAKLLNNKAQLHKPKELLIRKIWHNVAKCEAGLKNFESNIANFYSDLLSKIKTSTNLGYIDQKQAQIMSYKTPLAQQFEDIASTARELYEQTQYFTAKDLSERCNKTKDKFEELIANWARKSARNMLVYVNPIDVFSTERGEIEASVVELYDTLKQAKVNLKVLALADLKLVNFKSLYGEKLT